MLSILIPVHNALEYLKECLASIEKNTKGEYEIIILNDKSDEETTHFLQDYVYGFSGRIQLFHNDEQQWVNFNWNAGVELANGEHIVIINSDIRVPPNWNEHLIEVLTDDVMISCPFEYVMQEGKLCAFTIKPFMPPHMIKGNCFMFRAKDKGKMFPIPSQIKHWCGDNYIADQCLRHKKKVIFTRKVIIAHAITKSTNFNDDGEKKQYWTRVLTDLKEYMKVAHKKSIPYEKPIIENIKKIVRSL